MYAYYRNSTNIDDNSTCLGFGASLHSTYNYNQAIMALDRNMQLGYGEGVVVMLALNSYSKWTFKQVNSQQTLSCS